MESSEHGIYDIPIETEGILIGVQGFVHLLALSPKHTYLLSFLGTFEVTFRTHFSLFAENAQNVTIFCFKKVVEIDVRVTFSQIYPKTPNLAQQKALVQSRACRNRKK